MPGPRTSRTARRALLGIIAALPCVLAAIIPAAAPAAVLAPQCAPATLDASAKLAGAVTVTPLPGSRDASYRTQISFLGVPAASLTGIEVVGSRSGLHGGALVPYSQGDGASFVPALPFAQGESVTVHAGLAGPGGVTPFSWTFVVAEVDVVSHNLETPPPPPPPPRASEFQHFLSRPDLAPPTVTGGARAAGASSQDIFIAPYAGTGQYGPMILDPAGRLLWFKALPAGTRSADLRVQQYEGKPVLTWWQDPISSGGHTGSGLVIADSSYRELAVVRAGNGYEPDLHSFTIMPQGTALTTVYDAVRCNLTAEGGPANGAVADTLVQEIDLRTGLVRYEWHSLDHVALSDSYIPLTQGGWPQSPWDFFHINRIDPQPNGDLLVDSRNTWAAYEVDPGSGQIIWRLGGKHSSFAMGPGAAPAWQHDAVLQPNGTITLFDNGASPRIHPQSRALVLALNLANMTASLLESYVHPSPPLVAASQGDMEELEGGNWFVGWGQEPWFTEYDPAGHVLFDAHLPAGYQSYTAFRFPWSARPAQRPAVAVRAGARGSAVVYSSWDGATSVAQWRIVGGPNSRLLRPLASAPRRGFETSLTLARPPRYLQSQAMDARGHILARSPTVAG